MSLSSVKSLLWTNSNARTCAAPQDGTVFQSTVHTVGGVIPAGEPIMMIVPNADKLTVEAKVNPQDIDKVQLGQSATLRFSAFNVQDDA